MWTRLYLRNVRPQDCTKGHLLFFAILSLRPRSSIRMQVETYVVSIHYESTVAHVWDILFYLFSWAHGEVSVETLILLWVYFLPAFLLLF